MMENGERSTSQTFSKLLGKGVSRKLCKKVARIAVSASYRIFHRRRDLEWHCPGLIEMAVD